MHPAIPLALAALHPGTAAAPPSLDARTALVLDAPSPETTFTPQPTMSDETYARRAGEWLKGLPAIAVLEKAVAPPSGDTAEVMPWARRADAWYFRQPQRIKRFDRDLRVAFASAGRDDTTAEHAWSCLLEAGLDDPQLTLPCLAALALRRGRPSAADALLRDWRPTPDAEAALAPPALRLRVDLANGAFAAADHALSPPPEALRAFAWEAVVAAPPPSVLLDRLRARNLMEGLQRAPAPFLLSADELAAMRTRHGFGLRAPYADGAARLLGVVPDRDVANIAVRICFRVMQTFGPDKGVCAILLADEEAERAWEKAGRPGMAAGRQLGVHFDLGDPDATVVPVANGVPLVRYDEEGFNDGYHVLHLVQYENRGEIFLDHRRVALVPLTPRTRRPLFLIRAERVEIAVTELDVWELGE